MIVVPETVIDALRRSHLLGLFFRLDTAIPMRVWLGINDIPAGIESVDPSNQETYLGGGILHEIPNLEAVLNGKADRAEFIISGIDPNSMAPFDMDEIDVRGKDFHVAITTLDDNYQPMSNLIPLMTGRGSFLTERSDAVTGTDNQTITLGLSVGFGITTRDRNSQVLWSPQHQKAMYPTDQFCDNTARLERGVAPAWPRY